MNEQCFWLFDGAQLINHEEFQTLFIKLAQAHRLQDLYSQESEALHLHGPILCELKPDEIETVEALIEQYIGCYASCLVVNASLNELATQWRKFVNFLQCESGERYYLRYADTRVLEVLPRIMNAPQWHALTEYVQTWRYVNRAQKIQSIAPKQLELPKKGTLIWTDHQLALLIDATWPDALLAEVWVVNPDIKNPKLIHQQWQIMCEVYAAAKTQGKESDLAFQMKHAMDALATK
jgi:hypothetical protein